MPASSDVTIALDRSVALVLFDFLSRTADEEEGEPLNDALQHRPSFRRWGRRSPRWRMF